MKNSIIEISKKKTKAGRTPITMILHEIHKDEKEYNKNGITWVKEYCEQNIESIKGMQLVTQFLDENKEIPFGSHGNMIIEENKVIFEDSLVVGSFEEGHIVEGIEVNGKVIDAVVGKGYIYNQRFPKLVEYLQEQYDNNIPVEGSVEISANESVGNTKIIYDGGWKPKGRKPQIFEYSGHAIVIGEAPADDSALMLELNSYIKKEGENKVLKTEVNAMNIDDISILAENAFNKKFNENRNDYQWFYIHKFYPTISTLIMKSWGKVGEYYRTTYTVDNGVVTIGDIIKVEEDWQPIGNAQSVEINTPIKNIITKYKEVNVVDEKVMLELNQKIEDKVNEINSLNKTLESKEVEINELNEKVKDLEKEVTELNTTMVEVNKLLEAEKSEKESLVAEVNTFKEEKAKIEEETRKAEVNAYFENEIPKNGFDEAEINSLKQYVESYDLDGLKKAESELCTKKFKEMISSEQNTEVNTQGQMFIAIKEKEKKEIKGTIPSFFVNQ